jgi:AmiR/NasT family two-component response regulator
MPCRRVVQLRIFIADPDPRTAAIVRAAYPEADLGLVGDWASVIGEARAFRPDVVLVAVPAADVAGTLPIFQALRAAPETHAAFLVAVLGSGQLEHVAALRQAGARGFSGLPFDPTSLHPFLQSSAAPRDAVDDELDTLDSEDEPITADGDAEITADGDEPITADEEAAIAVEVDEQYGRQAMPAYTDEGPSTDPSIPSSTDELDAPPTMVNLLDLATDDGGRTEALLVEMLQNIRNLVATLAAPGSPTEIAQVFVERCGTMLAMDRAVLYLRPGVDGELMRVGDSRDPSALPAAEPQPDPSVLHALHTGRSLVLQDATSENGVQVLGGAAPYGAVVSMPLGLRGQVVGVLCFTHDSPRSVGELDRHLASCMGSIAAVLIAATTLLDRLTTDELAPIPHHGAAGSARVGFEQAEENSSETSLDRRVDEMLRELEMGN